MPANTVLCLPVCLFLVKLAHSADAPRHTLVIRECLLKRRPGLNSNQSLCFLTQSRGTTLNKLLPAVADFRWDEIVGYLVGLGGVESNPRKGEPGPKYSFSPF